VLLKPYLYGCRVLLVSAPPPCFPGRQRACPVLLPAADSSSGLKASQVIMSRAMPSAMPRASEVLIALWSAPMPNLAKQASTLNTILRIKQQH
jgi:hypothetical protein